MQLPRRPRVRAFAVPLLLFTLGVSVPGAWAEEGAPESADQLQEAARAGDLETVRELVEGGVPVDAVDKYGTTPLSMAVSNGHPEVVRYLLDQGADIDHADQFYGSTPLGWSYFTGDLEMTRLLLERGAEGREGALQYALSQGDLETARAAVAGGPLHESTLTAARARAGEMEEAWQSLLEGARSRPDPVPPEYTVEELHRFTGLYEGWTSGTEVEVVLREGRLLLAVDAERIGELAATGEQSFQASDGSTQTAFSGRAGTIEGLQLMRADQSPEYLRRSVAEPRAAARERFAAAEMMAHAGEGTETVHWPAFRGANAAGIGDGADTPVGWDLESGQGVVWQSEIPGLGNSSPVVWGDRVFLTTAVAEGKEQAIRTGLSGSGEQIDDAVEHSWRVLAFDKSTGRRLWETEVGRAVPLTRRHYKATQANSTPATDGRYLVAVFPTVGIVCLDLDGTILWRHELGPLNAGAFTDPGQEWGFASSPILHGDRVIAQIDVHEGAYLAAWDLATGEPRWRTERQVAPSWATPTLLQGPEGEELVVNGSTIHGYDPQTGEELWSLAPNSELVIATPVAGPGVAYVSAGYPPVKPIYAVPAGTRGALEVKPGDEHPALAWSHGRGGAYMPTPILYRGLLYVVHHNGRLVAYDAASGEAIYKQRFSRGGTFTGSPVAVNGKLYTATEEGLVYVLEAGPEYRELAVNETGEPLMATPAVSEGTLFLRTPTRLIAVAGRDDG